MTIFTKLSPIASAKRTDFFNFFGLSLWMLVIVLSLGELLWFMWNCFGDERRAEASVIDDAYHNDFVKENSFEESDFKTEQLDLNTFEFNNVHSEWNCCFEQPNLKPNFYQRLKEKNAILESIHANHNVLEGTVRVQNISYHKKISLRYTFDEWKTHNDLKCDFNVSFNYEHVLTDQFKFSFEITEGLFAKLLEENKYINSTSSPFFKVQFAVCYETFNDEAQQETIETYWDNNDLNNYCFECYLKMVA